MLDFSLPTLTPEQADLGVLLGIALVFISCMKIIDTWVSYLIAKEEAKKGGPPDEPSNQS